MNEFNDLVARLTRDHLVTVHTDDGPTYITLPSLLQQLRDEMFGGSNRAGVAGSKHKLPLNAPALDLYALIDRQISEVWGVAFNRVPGMETTEQLLTQWAAYIGEDKIVRYSTPETHKELAVPVIWTLNECTAINLLRRWARAIEELFNPPKTAPIVAACIQCSEREVWRSVDGEMIAQSALVFIRDRDTEETTEAKCQACGATWTPDQFLYLAQQIGANEKAAKEKSGMDLTIPRA